jgi:hypothetical protein
LTRTKTATAVAGYKAAMRWITQNIATLPMA